MGQESLVYIIPVVECNVLNRHCHVPMYAIHFDILQTMGQESLVYIIPVVKFMRENGIFLRPCTYIEQ